MPSFELPVPFRVTTRRRGSRQNATNSKRVYTRESFDIPSANPEELIAVASWNHQWNVVEGKGAADLVRYGDRFYAPVRYKMPNPHGGAEMTPFVKGNDLEFVVGNGLKAANPFSETDVVGGLGIEMRNCGYGDGNIPWASTQLPEDEFVVSESRESSHEAMQRAFNRLLLVDDVLYEPVGEPMIRVVCREDRVVMTVVNSIYQNLITPALDHYFRLDEADRAMELVEDRWDRDMIVLGFSDMVVQSPEYLSTDFEEREGLRGARQYFERIQDHLKQYTWETAAPWYVMKTMLKNPDLSFGDIGSLLEQVSLSAAAMEKESELDPEWRDNTARFGYLASERWNFRPLGLSGPGL